MVAAWHLWIATGEDRWRALFLENVEQLWRTWVFDAEARCHLWTQDLYGRVVQYLGAAHGFAGNVYPLLRARRCSARSAAKRFTTAAWRHCRPRRSDKATPSTGSGRWVRTRRRAPADAVVPRRAGIVTALADFPPQRSAAMDGLLLGAGNAVWQAGPLAKGTGCAMAPRATAMPS